MKENESLIKDENEAIEAIKSNMPTSGYYMLRQSLEMAIKALEDVQEYQKIGTVEEVRELKELEKILEEIKRIKDGNRKEKLYAKYPPDSKNQEVLNAYSQGYEDGTDNFYNAIAGIIRKHMNDGWIPIDEDNIPDHEVLACNEYGDELIGYVDVAGYGFFCEEGDSGICMYDVVAWMEKPEPYKPERSNNA